MENSTAQSIAHELVSRYAFLWDDRRFDEWIALFTEDPRFYWRGRCFEGRLAIQDNIGAGNASRGTGPGLHMMANTIAHDGTDDIVRASSDFQFSTLTEGRVECLFAGRVYDIFHRTQLGWCFSSRRLRFLGEKEEPDWIHD